MISFAQAAWVGLLLVASTSQAALRPDLDRLASQLALEHPEVPQSGVVRAFTYLEANEALVGNRDFVTIIDFSQPSFVERMHVIELGTAKVASYLVAHGKNSGLLTATQFSNIPGSQMSSLGIYLTGDEYEGDHGRSLRLRGMEDSNSNAEARDIVLHAADYVSPEFIESNGYLGRSLGCPAVDPRYRDLLVGELRGGSILLIQAD